MVVGGVDADTVAWAARIIRIVSSGKRVTLIVSCIRQHAGANPEILVLPVHHILIIMVRVIHRSVRAAAANLNVNVPISGWVAAVLLEDGGISRTAGCRVKFRILKVILISSRNSGVEKQACPALHGRIPDSRQARPIFQQVGLFFVS